MDARITRRDLLAQGGIAGLALAATAAVRAVSALGVTPAQPEGPFYPVRDQPDKDTDLTRVQGHARAATGQTVLVNGRVLDASGRPVPGALVEIWQACATGRYNHPDDSNNQAALDEDFQYWGRATTDARGAYSFRTIKPGAYPADAGWVRPPHIHFRVVAPGLPSLTTQMYFAGEALNAADRILRSLPAEQRKLLTVSFAPAAGGAAVEGVFDIVVGRPGTAGVTPEVD
ncbi:MAG: intradiol ring-cleavage dioxygenase [Candidatus Wallbacteria bacterium]|nr:intradiol ring-cleavage dioxygenase [Candidatus Wallbacteria bacterium]